jgi:hypothetical protein
MGAFNPSATHYCTFEKRWDADGTVWMQVQAGGTLVAKTPYFIIANEFGAITTAIANTTTYGYVGVAQAAAVITDIVWLQIGGFISDMICTSGNHTAGHGIKKYDATIVTSGADYSGAAGEFAVATEAGTTVTAIDAMLIPERIIGTT